ncbi:AAA family ATPase [Photobacterium sanguinicancri]|uniref:AAA family ATPase n=1 Tax=Photobacterium sanguinicancri TaxID=875932 RepID=UPI00247FE431|nr:AAA family ATPase [Photobacterium sanguinicancri]
MIFALLVRNYKIYRGWNYIPVSNGTNFTAFVGENGVGKSSVLEALDTFFNKPTSDWNFNHSTHKSGFADREPTICPIFMLPKTSINSSRNLYKQLETISDITWQLEAEDFHNSNLTVAEAFHKQKRDTLEHSPNAMDEYFLFPVGIKKTKPKELANSLGIFDKVDDYKDRLATEGNFDLESVKSDMLEYISSYVDYIYLPSEIDFESYTKIEGKTIQALMGKTIDEMIKEFIDESVIKNINRQLGNFLDDVSNNLEKYEYKKPGKKQTLFNLTHLSSKVIETYFESKVLNLIKGTETTPVYDFSSGEKRKALIDIAKAFLIKTRKDKSKKIILAIDEPEISLHTSSCFEQFEKIKDISNRDVQALITTHWYGFMPIVSDGLSVYIADYESQKQCHAINLKCFRDDFKSLREKTSGKLPTELELKSINDLVQSITASITSSDYNWVICEGSSDKIYLEHLNNDRKQMYILPIGGSKNVKKIFEYLYLALQEERSNIKGKVFLLLDTDKKFEQYDARDSIKDIKISRLLNSNANNTTKLVKTSDNTFFPPTEIEDCLNAVTFLKALRFFYENGYEHILSDLIDNLEVKFIDAPSGFSFDLRDTEKATLEEFFNLPRVKVKFALKYVELDTERQTLPWFEEILNFLN